VLDQGGQLTSKQVETTKDDRWRKFGLKGRDSDKNRGDVHLAASAGLAPGPPTKLSQDAHKRQKMTAVVQLLGLGLGDSDLGVVCVAHVPVPGLVTTGALLGYVGAVIWVRRPTTPYHTLRQQ
jgi:hypothetical protein